MVSSRFMSLSNACGARTFMSAATSKPHRPRIPHPAWRSTLLRTGMSALRCLCLIVRPFARERDHHSPEPLDFLQQPRPRIGPITLGRWRGYPEHLRGFLETQPREETEVDEPGFGGISSVEPVEGLFHQQQPFAV